MLQKLVLSLLFLIPVFCFGQNLGISSTLSVGTNNGNYHPQIEVNSLHEPMVLWTDVATKSVYFSKKTAQVFDNPIQLNPNTLLAQSYNWSGPDMAVENEKVYVVFRSDGYETGHAYLVKSLDNGTSFSDTIRIDHLTEGYAQYPDIAVLNDTIYTIYMAHDAMGMNPQYVLSRSFDGGNTFENSILAGELVGDEACDCCQAEIVVNESAVIILFRNNASNIRDIKGVVSYDRGNSFTQILDVDAHNWNIQSCPSTGPDGRISSNNMLYSTYKSIENSTGKVFLNTYDLNQSSVVSTINLSEGILNGANYPQLALKNDTLGFVFEGIGTQTDVFFMHSYTGESGVNISNRINLTNASGVQNKPDVAIDNGAFHVVYADGSTLKYVTLGENVGLEDQVLNAKQKCFIYSKQNPLNLNEDLQGKKAFTLTGEQIDLTQKSIQDLSNGTYFLVGENAIQKLIIIP